jgi:hypothetical protein
MILTLGTIPGPGATRCDPFGCIQACSIRMPNDHCAQLQLATIQGQASSEISPCNRVLRHWMRLAFICDVFSCIGWICNSTFYYLSLHIKFISCNWQSYKCLCWFSDKRMFLMICLMHLVLFVGMSVPCCRILQELFIWCRMKLYVLLDVIIDFRLSAGFLLFCILTCQAQVGNLFKFALLFQLILIFLWQRKSVFNRPSFVQAAYVHNTISSIKLALHVEIPQESGLRQTVDRWLHACCHCLKYLVNIMGPVVHFLEFGFIWNHKPSNKKLT